MEKHSLYKKFLELRENFSLEDLFLVFTRKKALAFEYIRQGFAGDICEEVFQTVQTIAMELDVNEGM